MANETTGEMMAEATNKLTEAQRVVMDRTKQYVDATDTYVHENPWVAIAVGAGIGLLVGILIARD
jgi:ElaB/YqjD/DUF883 family membrane-anchored ribosome-binding protein